MAEKKPGAHVKSEGERKFLRLNRTRKKEYISARKLSAVPVPEMEGSSSARKQPPAVEAYKAEQVLSQKDSLEQKQASKVEILEKRRKRRKKEFRSLGIRVVLYLIIIYVLFFHIVGVMIVPSDDMSPRLEAGDLVVYYRLGRDVHAQDVVVLEKAVDAERASAFGGIPAAAAMSSGNRTVMGKIVSTLASFDRAVKKLLGRPIPEEKGEQYVSRIVAAPGDTVEIGESERLIVNGNAIVESNIFYSTPEYMGFVKYPLTLGDGEYFVLSDHRQGAADSRFFGPVKVNEILGVVITAVRRNNL